MYSPPPPFFLKENKAISFHVSLLLEHMGVSMEVDGETFVCLPVC